MANERLSLLSSTARVQVPWIKVTIGEYTFGVYSRTTSQHKDAQGNYSQYNVQYPNFIQSLNIVKVNGQINQYTLVLRYPVKLGDDPNFFEKVFGSVSATRKIIFSYGDMSMPSYVYREEEALITKISTSFNLQGGIITYTINAVSSAALNAASSWTFQGQHKKPSDEIKRLVKTTKYGLKTLFTAMSDSLLNVLIDGDDKAVDLKPKRNISAIDYINYLVSCMVPAGWTTRQTASTDIYLLTMHDDAAYDTGTYVNTNDGQKRLSGSYFKVKRVSYKTNKSDAFQLDIGFGNSSTIVTNFQLSDDQNYALLYDYNTKLTQEQYVKRLDNNGRWVEMWSPSITSKNDTNMTQATDITWWTKITKFPIKATITVQGLLRPAILMNYVRLNVLFPGGRKHISSGLYMVTRQEDNISGENGYKTTLSLTKIGGDEY